MSTRRKKKPQPERQLIARAIKIIEIERSNIVGSYTDGSGNITDHEARGWIRNFDRFLKPARKYLERKR